MIKIVCENEFETKKFAKKLAEKLSENDIVVLSGELGSGKTKFVEGILEYFQLEDEISSPTFNIVNEYKTNFIEIFHFDLYRLQDIDEFDEIGGEEYFNKGLCLIEWGELVESILPKKYIKIVFEKDKNNNEIRNLFIELNTDTIKEEDLI